MGYVRVDLALADSKYFRATGRAYALSCRLAVLHSDAFGVFHFLLGTALHAISLHIQASSCFCSHIKPFAPPRSSRLLPFGNKKREQLLTAPQRENKKGVAKLSLTTPKNGH